MTHVDRGHPARPVPDAGTDGVGLGAAVRDQPPGPLALAVGLHDALAAGAGERSGARIVALTSGAHMNSPVVLLSAWGSSRGSRG